MYTNRCIIAIVSLEKEVITWPDSDERRFIARRIKQASTNQTPGFPDCVGLVDGSLFVFQDCPTKDGEDFYSRKGRYGMNVMVICDDQKRIRYFVTGWPGCAHDARVFKNSTIAEQPDDFFSGSEYVIGDSAYTLSSRMITPFKKPSRGSLSTQEHRFNNALSGVRVSVEHCIGILKGRFQSLRGMRKMHRNERGLRTTCHWFRACAILHNLVVSVDEVSTDWVESEEEMEAGEEGFNAQVGSASVTCRSEPNEALLGRQKRLALMDLVIGSTNS